MRASGSPVQQQVLRLQVPVHDGQAVEVVQRRHDLRGVEEGGGVVEPAGAAQVAEQLAPAHVGEQHVEEALVLGAPAQVHQEGVVDLLEYRSFRKTSEWTKK